MLFLLAILFNGIAGSNNVSGQNLFTFSPEGGFYEGSVTISIDLNTTAEQIRITKNGERPSREAMLYKKGTKIHLTNTTLIRCAAYDKHGKLIAEGGLTYFVGEPKSTLTTISVGISPWRLFDPVSGWFVPGPKADKSDWKMPKANFWTHDEYPGHLDLFGAEGTNIFNGTVGYRLFGGMSRLHPQKSLSVSWRKKYGDKRLEYPIFGKRELHSFKYLVFRNGGSDWSRTHFRDAMMSDLLKDKSWDLEHQANKPARLYINGKYWGLYYIREKINRTFVADHRGFDRDSVDLLEHQIGVKAGSSEHYKTLISFLNEACYFVSPQKKLNDERLMSKVESMMDVDNFMRLQIAQMYFDNRDAGGNIRYYRPWKVDALGTQKWRWILYDLDYGFGLHDPEAYTFNTLALHTAEDGTDWPNPAWSTFIQRCLLTNQRYRNAFVNRSLDYLQTDFSTAAVVKEINRHTKRIAPEMERALARWKLRLDKWEYHVDRLHTFAEERPAYVREHLREIFSGGEDRTLSLANSGGGSIVINDNVSIDNASWQGQYFENYPIRLKAVPNPGFRFVRWEGIEDSNIQQQPIQVVSLGNKRKYEFNAIFEPYKHPEADKLIITELSVGEATGGCWVEMYNGSDKVLNLRDWQLVWEDKLIRLPNANVSPFSYFLVYGDAETMNNYDAKAKKGAKELIALKELSYIPCTIGLYNSRGAYVNEAKLPTIAVDYIGLAGISLNNSNAENWLNEQIVPSPNRENEVDSFYFHVHFNQLWERLGIALLLIIGMWYWLNRKSNQGD